MDITRIYLVENCFGDPNKIYIGKTKYSRESIHRRTFGAQITYTYIDEVEGCKKEGWKSLEIFWIEQFRQWGFELMNKNEGGGGPTSHTEETKQKMRHPKSSTLNMYGTKPNSCKSRSHFPKGSDNGNYGKLRSYFPKGLEHGNYKKSKPLRTQEHKKNISGAKKGKSLTHNKIWNENISKGKLGIFTSKSKPIKVTNITNNEIIIVRNAKEASRITGISASKIRNLTNKVSNSYKNFTFELFLTYL
jgi:hypothetical protein